MRPRDTTPEAHEVQIEVFRRMTPEMRGARAVEMSEQARAITLAGIRQRHPEYDEQTARYGLFRILVGDDLFKKAWPCAPLVEP